MESDTRFGYVDLPCFQGNQPKADYPKYGEGSLNNLDLNISKLRGTSVLPPFLVSFFQ